MSSILNWIGKRFHGHSSDLKAVLHLIEVLRTLEREAAADPGREVDHEHSESLAFRRFDEAWRELHSQINLQRLPETWLEFHEWLADANQMFGNVEMPGVHYETCRWLPAARSLKAVLRDSILERAKERLARPEDKDLWTDPRVATLVTSLARTEWVAVILSLLTPVLRIDENSLDANQQEVLARLRAELAAFEYRGLEVGLQGPAVVVRLLFGETLAVGQEIVVTLANRDTMSTIMNLQVYLEKREASVLWAGSKPGGSFQIRTSPGCLEMHVPRQEWKSRAIPAGARLTMLIHSYNLRYLAGCVAAPEVDG